MKDFNKPLRKAFYDLLNGVLTYNSAVVPFYDQKVKKGQDPTNYVLVNSIYSTNSSTFHSWNRQMNIVLDIITRVPDAANTNTADAVAEQIFGLLMPTITSQDVLTQPNFQYMNIQLDADRYLDSSENTMFKVRRLLTFSITVNQI